jgi:hypothetical protein
MEEDTVDVNTDKITAGSKDLWIQTGCLAFCKSFSTSVLHKGRGVYSVSGNSSSAPGMWLLSLSLQQGK